MVNKKFGGGLGRDEIKRKAGSLSAIVFAFFAFSQLTNCTESTETKDRRRD